MNAIVASFRPIDKCGLSRTTAVEKLRVAYALTDLPQIEEAFKQGHLSYSKVRALTRAARVADETALLDHPPGEALGRSASQVEARCRELRNGDVVVSLADARRVRERRSLTRYFHQDGSASISIELPREDAELIKRADRGVYFTRPDGRPVEKSHTAPSAEGDGRTGSDE